jgi:hypothetical protein
MRSHGPNYIKKRSFILNISTNNVWEMINILASILQWKYVIHSLVTRMEHLLNLNEYKYKFFLLCDQFINKTENERNSNARCIYFRMQSLKYCSLKAFMEINMLLLVHVCHLQRIIHYNTCILYNYTYVTVIWMWCLYLATDSTCKNLFYVHICFHAGFDNRQSRIYLISTKGPGGRGGGRSVEDAYSSAAPDPTFSFVGCPCCPTLDFAFAF